MRAIAIASFELTRPAGMGRLHFDGGSTFAPEQADDFIRMGKNGLEYSLLIRKDYIFKETASQTMGSMFEDF